jgi:hypothetical protein
MADSLNSDTTAPSGRELYHLQFSLQVASPETFGYTLVFFDLRKRKSLHGYVQFTLSTTGLRISKLKGIYMLY